MTQSIIAADLDAYESAMWFTSSYLIVMASLAPLIGRLAMIFSPGHMVLVSALFFAVGAVVTSQARSFGVFILGRVLTGVGGGGVLTLAMILVLQLTSKKRRGLFIGLTNAVSAVELPGASPKTGSVLTCDLFIGVYYWTLDGSCCIWRASFHHGMGMLYVSIISAYRY